MRAALLDNPVAAAAAHRFMMGMWSSVLRVHLLAGICAAVDVGGWSGFAAQVAASLVAGPIASTVSKAIAWRYEAPLGALHACLVRAYARPKPGFLRSLIVTAACGYAGAIAHASRVDDQYICMALLHTVACTVIEDAAQVVSARGLRGLTSRRCRRAVTLACDRFFPTARVLNEKTEKIPIPVEEFYAAPPSPEPQPVLEHIPSRPPKHARVLRFGRLRNRFKKFTRQILSQKLEK